MEAKTKDTVYGKIISDFIPDQLANLCDTEGGVQTGPFGSQLHKEDYVEEGTPIITVEHLGENRIIHQDLPRVSDTDRERLSKYNLKKGDIVFSRVGSVDRRALVRDEEDGWLFSGRCLRVRPKSSVINPEYLSYFFGLPAFKQYIRSIAVGATMPSLNTKLLSDVPIYYPSCIHEQKAIAHILSTMDEKIELNSKMNNTLEAISQAIFKSWFVDFDPVKAKASGESPESICRRLWLTPRILTLFPDRFEDSELGEIPLGWSIQNIGDVAEITAGKRPEKKQDKPSIDCTVPLYGGAGLIGYVPRPLFSDAIIVTGRVGTLGIVHRVTHPIWPSDNTLVLKAKKSNVFEFLYISLLNMDLQNLNRGSTQPLLTQRDLGRQLLIMPQNKLLESFTKLTHSIFSRIEANKRETSVLSELRDTLLPSLLSGELKVPVNMNNLE